MRSETKHFIVLTVIIFLAAGALFFYLGSVNTFGGSFSNVKTVTLASGTLYSVIDNSTPAYPRPVFAIAVNNPLAPTAITSLTLVGEGLSIPITQWSTTPDNRSAINFNAPYSSGGSNSLNGSSINTFVLYALAEPSLKENITDGGIYDYVINFGNGQSISGSLIAQGATSFPISYSYFINSNDEPTSSTSSICTIAPYTTLQTTNSSQGIYTTLETYSC
jgi:hypothetical protein